MAASAQVALVIDLAVIKYKYLEVVSPSTVLAYDHTQELQSCIMTDSARDKDEVTKDKKMTICLKLMSIQ